MIKSFGNPETQRLFHQEISRRLPPNIQRRALMKLLIIHAATDLNDLRIPPSNHLERLKGTRSEEYSIRINDQWRICFEWSDGNAYNVQITDYH